MKWSSHFKTFDEQMEFLKRTEKQRDREIYDLFLDGWSVNDISKKYIISPQGCYFIKHKQSLLRKYG